MPEVTFTIAGNHNDPKGNPVPKLKMTGKQHWMDKAKQYVLWKEYVTGKFYDGIRPHLSEWKPYLIILATEKPIVPTKGKKIFMSLEIQWKDNTHPDPENVFGSIADALFFNDKCLAGSFDFKPEVTGSGKVVVKIKV